MIKNNSGSLDVIWKEEMIIIFRDALLATSVSAIVALLVNLVHSEPLDYFADQDYEILVPCPEPVGEVSSLQVQDPLLLAEESYIVDARPASQYQRWHFRYAVNVTYDYLEPTPERVLQKIAQEIAKSRVNRVVVYGDGDTPDTGEQLAKELSGKGIKNVFFVVGGAPAIQTLNREKGDS